MIVGLVSMRTSMTTTRWVSFRDACPQIPNSRYSTHAFHSYPAQLIPHIPYYFLKTIDRDGDSLLFDPFCGTGTVLVEAMHNGWDSVGVEINPVAALIAKVKTTPVYKESLEIGLEKIARSYDDKSGNFNTPDFQNIHYWFRNEDISKLAKIKFCIDCLDNPDVRDLYKVTFSSIIKDVSKADPRIYVPVLPNDGYVKKRFDAWDLFRKKSLDNINKMQEFVKLAKNNTTCRIFNENIMNFEKSQCKPDLVITSPPYISAQKYVRSTRLEAYWLGYTKNQQLDINRKTIGTERIAKEYYSKISSTGLDDLDSFVVKIFDSDPIRAAIVSKYFNDMTRVIRKVYTILNSGGKCIFVVGNNTVKGYKVQTSEYIAKICQQQGFSLEKVMVDKILSRALMTKRNTTANLINYEWVLVMRKT